jgi:hypothetical protein
MEEVMGDIAELYQRHAEAVLRYDYRRTEQTYDSIIDLPSDAPTVEDSAIIDCWIWGR